ncbi:sigma-54 dependent transcriptional regulator [Pseudomonas sp.]|uniref:sigma-54 dependent transcriptional regulator n=1 Tax=Pseudomonas sp. TaxID=306 RepID=UPI00273495CC|nr:sigma-54 dependent transcriptional regulator [Pseudomonas sp.]MDP3813853.1 sigma 54-interacting transcriptional regulator [Pseudomonas sp.]
MSALTSLEPERPRRALLLDLSSEITPLHLQDWVFDRVTTLGSAQGLLKQNSYRVGIALLPDLTEAQFEPIETLLDGDEHLAWLALIQHEALEKQDFRRLIYEHFYDYFSLPLDGSLSHLKQALGHLDGMSRLRALEQETFSSVEEFQMVGGSKHFLAIFDQIRRVAGVEAPVLIRGDTGVGKEMIARAIHQRSLQAEGQFVAVNCGALPETLIHAELFGYEKGAFTGAYKRKIGRIEAAQNGTIFLDEIGDLPPQMQVYLLRFLEQKTIERLGGNQSILVNARVIAATHVNLEQAVIDATFREDLYYRLNVLSIQVPRLAERGSDIELLARYFLHKFSKEYGTHSRGLTRQALEAMLSYSWPGNVRELINRIRRALVMSENRMISAADLGLEECHSLNVVVPLEQARAHAEELAVRNCLNHSLNNVSQASKLLGVSRVTLYRMMDKYGIR